MSRVLDARFPCGYTRLTRRPVALRGPIQATPDGQRETIPVTFLLVLAVLVWTLGLVLAVLGKLLRTPDRDARVVVRALPWPRIEIDVAAAGSADRGRPVDGPGTNGRKSGGTSAYHVHNGPDPEISTT